MSQSVLKNRGIGLSVLSFVLLFVAVERYEANAASVAAMNQMMQGFPFGLMSPFGQGASMSQMTPGIPAITLYAILFAVLSAVAAAFCFVGARRTSPEAS